MLEGVGRLVCALLLFAAGLGVTGAMLGTPLAFAVVAIGLEVVLHKRVGYTHIHTAIDAFYDQITSHWDECGPIVLQQFQNSMPQWKQPAFRRDLDNVEIMMALDTVKPAIQAIETIDAVLDVVVDPGDDRADRGHATRNN